MRSTPSFCCPRCGQLYRRCCRNAWHAQVSGTSGDGRAGSTDAEVVFREWSEKCERNGLTQGPGWSFVNSVFWELCLAFEITTAVAIQYILCCGVLGARLCDMSVSSAGIRDAWGPSHFKWWGFASETPTSRCSPTQARNGVYMLCTSVLVQWGELGFQVLCLRCDSSFRRNANC